MNISLCCKNVRLLPQAHIEQRPVAKPISLLYETSSKKIIISGVAVSLLLFQDQAASAAESITIAASVATILRPVLFIGQSLMLLRIVLSWFPDIRETDTPWIFAYVPTEPLLKATRKVVPPAFGVDISPVIWLALFSFIGEILIGPNGILNILQRSIS